APALVINSLPRIQLKHEITASVENYLCTGQHFVYGPLGAVSEKLPRVFDPYTKVSVAVVALCQVISFSPCSSFSDGRALTCGEWVACVRMYGGRVAHTLMVCPPTYTTFLDQP